MNLPPRHGKSETVKAYVEYSLGRRPELEVMYTSYTASLANRASRSIRNEVQSGQAFRRFFPNVHLAPDSRNVQQWNLVRGGGLRASGVGGSITGMGAGLLVLDDPIKGRKQAESPQIRQSTMDWLRADLLTRAAPDAVVVLIQTRWHVADPAGVVQAEATDEDSEFGAFRVRVLTLPALAEENDLLNRQPGEALWPARWPAEKLEKNRRVLGEYDFAALYQQKPFVRGGTVFRGEPARYTRPASLEGARLGLFVDTASSKRTSADYTAIGVGAAWGDAASGHVKLLEVVRRRMDLIEIDAALAELQARYPVPAYVEETAQSQPIIVYLRSRSRVVIGVRPEGDKYSRAQPVAAAWNRGDWRVPDAGPWVLDYLSEHAQFTGTDSDAHDDQVDVSSGLWRVLMGSPGWGLV